ncbi:MAG: hypothetical protein HZA06_01545 [Nitrospirae bacterium]|nr:hypothetical protein [Nitrospirota bacterium]
MYSENQDTNIITKLKNKIRRFILCNLHKDYIKEQESHRRGICLQCGKCCRLVYRCPFLKGSGENIWCQIYHNGRPKQCIAFPIDKIDIADVNFECGYYFDK